MISRRLREKKTENLKTGCFFPSVVCDMSRVVCALKNHPGLTLVVCFLVTRDTAGNHQKHKGQCSKTDSHDLQNECNVVCGENNKNASWR